MLLGIDQLLNSDDLISQLKSKRVAFLGHPASVNKNLESDLDLIMQTPGINIVCAFGPQHGMRGEKQDNMIESDDYKDPIYDIPVYSLYGKYRRIQKEVWDEFDVILVDLQDVGCRIYTFLTTLFYILEDAHGQDKEVWVLDRPNPAGRPIEGNRLDMNFSSFVGAGPLPMRHGLTLGEAGQWHLEKQKLDVNYKVVSMKEYNPEQNGDWGWPQKSYPWVNPSPNIPRLTCARQYAGTVLLEGTHLSEGRGTTTPLEMFGAPKLDIREILNWMKNQAPEWMEGAKMRDCFFEPTFHKFQGELCAGIQIHTEDCFYNPEKFKPYRFISLFLKAVSQIHPDFSIFKNPPYEYETEKLPIEILSGGNDLKTWVEESQPNIEDWDKFLRSDEESWEAEREPFLIYK